MDRIINYAGAIPLDTDILKPQRNTMTAIAMLAQAMFGSATCLDGLTVGPNSPAAMNVVVQPGSIYSLASLDASSYGSLAADTTHQLLKQGVILDTTTLAITPPGTVGYSQVFLVQCQFQEVDATAVVLPYYNASNPSQAYSGPSNSGAAQYTERKGTVVLSLKAGTAAATGSQVAPSPDAGWTALAQVTVANGASSITSGNIADVCTVRLATKLSGVAPSNTVTSVTSNTTLTAAQRGVILCNAAGGSFTITLPAASAGAVEYTFVRTDSSTNTVTIQRAGSDTIEGGTSIALLVGARASIVSDASSIWRAKAEGGAGATSITANATLTVQQRGLVLVNATGGNITITLPAASAGATAFRFARSDATTNTVTIQRAGSDTVEGGTSCSLLPQERMDLSSDGVSNWLYLNGPRENRLLGQVVFGWTGSAIALYRSYNVSGVARNAGGDYTWTFLNAVPNADYFVAGMTGQRGTTGLGDNNHPYIDTAATGSVRIKNWEPQPASSEDAARIAIEIRGWA